MAWKGALDAISALLGGENINWNGSTLAINGAVLNSNGQATGYRASQLVDAVRQVSGVVLQLKTIEALKEVLAVKSEQSVGNATVLTVEL